MDETRRAMLLGIPALAALAATPAAALPVQPGHTERTLHGHALRFVDLTHKLTSAFDFTPKTRRFAMEPVGGSGTAAGMRINRLLLVEHTGTHLDAPSHFDAAGASIGDLPLGDLIVPLAVLDLRARANRDGDVLLVPDDILAWEKRHGRRLPPDCCVALHSGYDPLAMLQRPPGAPFRSPGFGPEAAAFLIGQRQVRGIAVDSMSLDQAANMPAYPVHQSWLRSGRWGIEGLAGLAGIPEAGALLVVGAAPLEGATGVPIRAIAIF